MTFSRTFHIRVVIRVFRQGLVANIGSIVEIFQHLRCFLEIDVDHLLWHVFTKKRVRQVGLGICRVVLSTDLFRIVVVRNPNTPARGRACTAHLVLLLDDENVFSAHLPIADSRRQTTVSRSNNEYVNLSVPIHLAHLICPLEPIFLPFCCCASYCCARAMPYRPRCTSP